MDKFVTKNQEIKGYRQKGQDQCIYFFHSARNAWCVECGMRTSPAEKLHLLPLDLQARMMLATGDVDNLLIGNAYASEEEFKGLQEVVQESSRLNKDHMIRR